MDALDMKPSQHICEEDGEDFASAFGAECEQKRRVLMQQEKLTDWLHEDTAKKEAIEQACRSARERRTPQSAHEPFITNSPVKKHRYQPYTTRPSQPGFFSLQATHGEANLRHEFDSVPLKRTSSQLSLAVGAVEYNLTMTGRSPKKRRKTTEKGSFVVKVKLPDANRTSFTLQADDTVISLRQLVVQEMQKRYHDRRSVVEEIVLKNTQGFPLNLSDRVGTALKNTPEVVCYIE